MVFVYTNSQLFKQLMPFNTLQEAVEYIEKSKREGELDEDATVRYVEGVEMLAK